MPLPATSPAHPKLRARAHHQSLLYERCVTALEVVARPVSSHALRSTQNASAQLASLDTVVCGGRGRRFETVVEAQQHMVLVVSKAVEEWYALSDKHSIASQTLKVY